MAAALRVDQSMVTQQEDNADALMQTLSGMDTNALFVIDKGSLIHLWVRVSVLTITNGMETNASIVFVQLLIIKLESHVSVL